MSAEPEAYVNNKNSSSKSGANSSSNYGTQLSMESIKVIAESIGIAALPDDAAKELADDVSFKLKQIVQDAAKFMHHSKRTKLALSDIDSSLKIRNIEPQYGFVTPDSIPFRFASGGGRELNFMEEKEIDLSEVISGGTPKIPIDVSLRAHWLCIDGVQPTVPENPPPLSKEVQAQDSVNPVKKLEKDGLKDTTGKPTIGKAHKLKTVETVHVKQLATHELSVEQQLYYKEITEACVGSDEARRAEALQSLSCDPGLHEMLPRMCTFIAEGVKVNVVQNNLALLIYLMRMVRALLDNPALYLEKYLHELIPSVSTCIVSKQLCVRPELDNHWALRDFAARLMAQICKNFNTSTNNLQTRVTRLFSSALMNDKTPLSSLYGSLAGLSELGSEVIKVFIIPRIKFVSERIEPHLHGIMVSNTDKIAAGHIRTIIQKSCAPVIKTIRNPPDVVDDYKRDYGSMGTTLHQAVIKARQQITAPATTTQSSTPGVAIVSQVAIPQAIQRPQTTQIISKPISTPGSAIQRPAIATTTQKYVIVTQRPTTPAVQRPTQTVTVQPKFIGSSSHHDDLSHLE
ncbi:transcription initiation factor TFIID subunit 6 [Culicoides brevitarsis]|uniref:transcription initiation factor TFIID subunit 6 n=1 Tax=Culicoides brevitarsis TaxID=469753 RepID=UPI00307C1D79